MSPSVSWPLPLGNSGKQEEMRLTILAFQGKAVLIVIVIMGGGQLTGVSSLLPLHVDSRN